MENKPKNTAELNIEDVAKWVSEGKVNAADLANLVVQAKARLETEKAQARAKREAIQAELAEHVSRFEADFRNWLGSSGWKAKAAELAREFELVVDIKACMDDTSYNFSLLRLPEELKTRKTTGIRGTTGTTTAELLKQHGSKLIPTDVASKYLKPFVGMSFKAASRAIDGLKPIDTEGQSVKKNARYQLKVLMDNES